MARIPVIYPENCTGCGICELVCSARYGSYNPKKSHVTLLRNDKCNINIPTFNVKCDLCQGISSEPKCEKFCPFDAIKFIDQWVAVAMRKEVRITGFPAPIVRG